MKKFLFFLIAFLLLINISFGFISAAEDTDYSKELGLKDKTITGSGLELKKTNEGYVFSFSKENSILTIKGNSFENIKSSGSNPREIVLDRTGIILRAKFTTNEKGGSYNIDGEGTQINAPPNSLVQFDRSKNGKNKNTVIVKPEKSSDIIPPVLKNKNTQVSFEGTDMKMNGNSFSGILRFDEKGAFIESSEVLSINRLRIGNSEPGTEKEIRLFFDGEMHDGNSVSIGPKELYINSLDSKLLVEFLENNPYARIDKNDIFAFEVGEKSQVKLQNRDESGLIPAAFAKGENVAVLEDAKSIFARGDNIDIEKLGNKYIGSTTSPIELFMAKSDGSDFLGAFAGGEKILGYKILVDNFNRIALIPKDSQEGFSISENINTRFSTKVSYNYPTKDEIESLTEKKITMDKISQGRIDEALGKLRDYWGTLNDETKSSIGNINFLEPTELGFFSASTEAETRNLNFKPGEFGAEEFIHESAHALQLDMREGFKDDPDIKKINDELEKINQKVVSSTNKLSSSNPSSDQIESKIIDIEKDLKDNLKRQIELIDLRENIFAKKIPFEKEWKAVAGSYDKVESIALGGVYKDYSQMGKEESDKLAAENGKDWMSKPRLGYVRPYGGQNILEDVATFVEKSDNPDFFKPLLDSNNPNYDVRYKEKIDMLYNYGFITKSKYQAIISK